MKKIFEFFIIGFILIFLSSCADYRAERKQLKLENEKLVLKKQREKDNKTCEYYGFKKNTNQFSNCLMELEISRKKNLIAKKMLECESVRRDNIQNSSSGWNNVSAFLSGVLEGARENLACN